MPAPGAILALGWSGRRRVHAVDDHGGVAVTAAWSRRAVAAALALGAALPGALARSAPAPAAGARVRIRAVTAGVRMPEAGGLDEARGATDFLFEARRVLEAAGYPVQTLRLATQPLAGYLPEWRDPQAMRALRALDHFAAEHGLMVSVGPVALGDAPPAAFADWAAALVTRTHNLSFSMSVASPARGVDPAAARAAAAAMQAVAGAIPGGEGNFRFAATAFCPPGTPFFPAAWFERGRAFSIGLESPNLLRDLLGAHREAVVDAAVLAGVQAPLARGMDAELGAVAAVTRRFAGHQGWRYLGIDASPAPGLDASIGAVVESLTGLPFGSPSTLAGCAAITAALQRLSVATCGYSGLMLPVLEDRVLARRAAEGRFGVAELLLYSSVCGTGLDVVPLPGDTPRPVLAGLIGDVAALAARHAKPLSARLLPLPGKRAGDPVRFDNPHLTAGTVMAPAR